MIKKYFIVLNILFLLISCLTIKTKKNVAVDYFNLGNRYFELKNYTKAIENYEKSLDYDPKSEETIFNLILSNHLNKNYDKTEKLILTYYKKINNEYTKKLIMLLGNNYYQQGKYEQALRTYNEYITSYPDDANCYFNIGLTYLKMANEKKAFSYFMEAYKRNNKHIPAIYNIADYYYKIKDYQNSHNYFLLILDLDNKNPDIYYRLAEIEYNIDEFEHSRKNLLKAIELNPKNPDYDLLLAKVYAKGYKDKNKTLEYLEKAFINDFKDLSAIQQINEFKLLFSLDDFKKLLFKYNIK